MHPHQPQSARLSFTGTNCPDATRILPESDSAVCAAPAQWSVGPHPVDDLRHISDEALQARIHHCAEQFIAAHKRYLASGCFAEIGTRDAWWRAEAEALVERGTRQGACAA